MPSPQWPRDWDALIPSHIQGLIFDCDGTVVDTMPVHYAAWCKALGEVGIAFPEERFYALAGATATSIAAMLAKEQGVTCDPAAVAHQKEAIYEASLHNLWPIENVVAIARRERGTRKLAIASGGRIRAVRRSLEVIGVADLFDEMVGAEAVTHGKPAPDLFLKAAELMGLHPTACAVYEDGELGLEAARRAGMVAIDVRPWYLPR